MATVASNGSCRSAAAVRSSKGAHAPTRRPPATARPRQRRCPPSLLCPCCRPSHGPRCWTAPHLPSLRAQQRYARLLAPVCVSCGVLQQPESVAAICPAAALSSLVPLPFCRPWGACARMRPTSRSTMASWRSPPPRSSCSCEAEAALARRGRIGAKCSWTYIAQELDLAGLVRRSWSAARALGHR